MKFNKSQKGEMTNSEKYEILLNKPAIKADTMSVQVHAPWFSVVEIRACVGTMYGNVSCGVSECRIFLKPKDVDELIDRLQVAKEAILERASTETEIDDLI